MREHGTRARYILGPDINDRVGHGCRCKPCLAANRDEVRKTTRLKLYGRWEPYVDAGPVRAHVEALRSYGAGWKTIAKAAGVPNGVMSKLIYGDAQRGMAPSKRVRPQTAEKILAVRPSPDLLPGGAMVDGSGTRRRLQALVAVGWSQSRLAARLGVERTNLNTMLVAKDGPVRAATCRDVTRLYAELWDQAPPESEHREKISASRARNYAGARGWLPPAAWDDDMIDLPADEFEQEIARQVAAMDDEELQRCHGARYRLGELSPLIVAAARERDRRRHASKGAAA